VTKKAAGQTIIDWLKMPGEGPNVAAVISSCDATIKRLYAIW
jgi:hypothetical protein